MAIRYRNKNIPTPRRDIETLPVSAIRLAYINEFLLRHYGGVERERERGLHVVP